MSAAVKHPALKARRDALRAAGRCICGPADGTTGARGVEHGPVVSAGKCQRCIDQHDGSRHSAAALAIRCPVCGSAPRVQCRSLSGAGGFTRMHAERTAAACRRAEAGRSAA